jgi:PAS domain S-box-containing protein
MDNVPDIIYFKDRKGRLILVNEAHAKGFGLKPRDVVGKTDFDLFPKKKAEMMARDDEHVFKSGKPIVDKIERATSPKGADNYVSTTKIPKYDEKGKIVGLIGITRDVTRRMELVRLKEKSARIKRRLEMLEELNKMKSEFISAVSHELRTPLATIKQLITLIFDEVAGPVSKRQREILNRTQGNIERLKNIIDELLDIARIESGRLKMHYSLVNLSDLVISSSDFFKKLAEEKGVRLDYYLPKKQVNLFIDADRVDQAFSNLLDNAIKFTEQGGKIKVEVKVFETKARIGVVDTGIGISKSNLPLLFNKFTQVSKMAAAERKGLGLGLSLAKEWVEKHGGEIWAESKLGAGSKFYFTLPRFYTPDVLGNAVRDEINSLLAKGISLCIINLSIVNYGEAKEKIKIGSKILFKDFEHIIDGVFKEIDKTGREKPKIVLTDIQKGKCNIILPRITEKKADRFANLLKDEIKRYFSKSKIEDVFVAIGILSYPRKDQPRTVKHLPGHIYIKKICVGLEKRHFKRIFYKANIKFMLSEKRTESAQTLDISEGGISFVSKRMLETDSLIGIGMLLPKSKKTINVKGRVAWIKRMERAPKESINKYKVGLEFTDLKNKDRRILSKEFKL